MTDTQACKILFKLTGFYNKTLTSEQTSTWIDELVELDEFLVQKVLNELKTHNIHSKFMPTQPEFLRLYKKYVPTEKNEQDYCYVCNNRGYDIGIERTIKNNKSIEYTYALHCDFCKNGELQKIKCGDYYSEPISSYYDIKKLIAKNKALHQITLTKNSEESDSHENIRTLRTLLSQVI